MHLRDPQLPPVAIITSQAAQYSVVADFQLEAQRRTVRALCYSVHTPAYVIAENQVEKLGSPKLAILPSPQALGEPAWSALLKYVDAGGNLLITGPVNRDEHWQIVDRSGSLGIQAHVEPLTYHTAELQVPGQSRWLSFGQQQQNWLDSLRFDDGTTLKEISHGKGKIFWSSYPVELAEDLESSKDLYTYVVKRVGIPATFSSKSDIPPGVLVYPTVLADSIMYVIVSDLGDDATIDIRDDSTGVPLMLHLPRERAAIAIIDKKQRKIVAKYGF